MQIRTFWKQYPIPTFALIGLILGIILRFGFGQPLFAEWVWYAVLILGGLPIAFQTIKGMFKGQFAADIVAMLAILTAIAMGQAFAGAVVVLMQSGGEAIEDFGMQRASFSLKALIERAPSFAYRKIDGHIEKIDIQQIQVGDILVVRTGDLIPADGTILDGTCEIDESAITGEPLAKSKGKGDFVLSGTVGISGTCSMRADKLSQESQYAKIIELVRKAEQEKAPIQRLADRYALFFTPLTLAMALLGFLLTQNPITILAVLVVATPCPLILATPLAVICGINKAADEGIIVKGGGAIEIIGSASSVIFDKTGTLTFGEPRIQKILSFAKIAEEEILFLAAVVEQLSSHSIAKAIVEEAMRRFPKLPIPTDFWEDPGQGVSGILENTRYFIGSKSYIEKRADLSPFSSLLDAESKQENILTFVVKEGTCLGAIVLTDLLRSGIQKMVERLHALGVKKIGMLTGDAKENALLIAKQAGIQHVEAELLPEDKVKTVEAWMKTMPPVVMVGDGINDAPALATASVGIAMGAHGSAISAETADIVFLVDDPTKVADAIEISRSMLRIAKQSIYIGMGLSFILMVAAISGEIPPAVGALLQEIIDVAVILNALRAR